MTRPGGSDGLWIDIDLRQQRLHLIDAGQVIREWSVSTAAHGAGERRDSGCTPRGWHVVRAKIGQGLPPGTVFVGRRPTGERYSQVLRARHPQRDWILTRILWLSGLEPGCNRLGAVDTMRRYIYIHGSPDDVPMGEPGSHGCVRMRNADVVELYERVPVGTRTLIHE
jgi:lipoprotein-anchoring transpeptidase ErfK/SrfK